MTPLAPLTMQELKLSQTLDGANMSPYHTTGEFATSLVLLRSRAESCTSVSLSIRFLLSHSQICACPTNICLKCVLPTSIVKRLSVVSPALFVKILLLSYYYLRIRDCSRLRSQRNNSIRLFEYFLSSLNFIFTFESNENNALLILLLQD